MWITPVTDEAVWEQLCDNSAGSRVERCLQRPRRGEAQDGPSIPSQHRPDLGADWVRENGELVIAGDWLTESCISDAEQLEVTAACGVLRLQRRGMEVFRA
ncbi:hypothetical protein [Serratia aquatilis]|uniref:Type I addiction module toxin, SymE family n=1 Tax=Serratia aquatilis TaxID=1737515 RepID=A0ABV6E7I0_9GAMM